MSHFGYDKRQILTSRTEELSVSQCFCDSCQAAARSHRVDMEVAGQVVRNLLKESFADPQLDPPRIDALVIEYPVLHDLFEFRSSIITELWKRSSKAANRTPLNYYVMDGGGPDIEDIWPSGVRLADLQDNLDRVTVLCYVRDPDVARQRIHIAQQFVDGPVDVGLTLDQDIIQDREELQILVETVCRKIDGEDHFYHHSLMTETQLNCIRSVL